MTDRSTDLAAVDSPKALWDLKQRQGHALHRICAYHASFPPQLPEFFLDRYPRAKTVLDPFCGRGTTLLEATLKGRVAHGCDLLPVARALSRVKLRCPPREEVLEQIDALDLAGDAPPLPEEFAPFYHPETWRQLWNLRESTPDSALTALALGRMHGHSPGFFSALHQFNVVSLPSHRAAAQNKKHGTVPEPRDVREILRKAAGRFIPELGHHGRGAVHAADAREIPLPDASVDLVITSPPFLDVVDYVQDNWLRGWFIEPNPSFRTVDRPPPTVLSDVGEYTVFLAEVLEELGRLLAPGGTIVFEVGPIKRKVALIDIVDDAAARAGLGVVEVLENDFAATEGAKSTPKISRAMYDGAETTTTRNQCLVLGRKGA